MKGFPKKLVNMNFSLAVPFVNIGKLASRLPVIKSIASLFFTGRFNQVTAIPIRNIAINENASLQNTTLPLYLVDRLIESASYLMVLDECVCRSYYGKEPRGIGCMVLGKAALDIHPSNGRIVDINKAKSHVKRAADAGLVANVAHVWIDSVGFGVTNFKNMVFICFCGHDSCLYTDNLHKRCSNLDIAYKRLEGINMAIDETLCSGCGTCAGNCFVSAILIDEGRAYISDACKGCGRCVDKCPNKAISIRMDDPETVFNRLLRRISILADIG